MPEIVDLRPNRYLAYTISGWPLLRHLKCFELPIISEQTIGSKELKIRLNYIVNDILVSKCMIAKTVRNKDDNLNELPTITSTNCQDKDDIELVEYDPDWFSLVKENTNFLSHITVDDDKACTVQYVCGPASAESRLDGQQGSQLDQEVSADKAQGQGQSQALESEKHRDIKTSLEIDASKSA